MIRPGHSDGAASAAVEAAELALFVDLYELTMPQAYLEEGMMADAVFTLFVRRLPEEPQPPARLRPRHRPRLSRASALL